MKKIKYIIAAIAAAFTFSSCLESGLEKLDTYKEANITSAYVYYRYIDTDSKIVASGENNVRQSTLKVSNDINAEAATCNIKVTLPSNFPASQVDKISASALVVAVQISTAAIIQPLDGAPALGTPADWTSPHQYKVVAADGTEKTWTITVKTAFTN